MTQECPEFAKLIIPAEAIARSTHLTPLNSTKGAGSDG
jgi:hypothetical protein